MNLLLDTHVLIWMSSDPERLSPRVRRLLEDETNGVAVSMVSFWEMAIKTSLGKLQLGPDWMRRLQAFMRDNAVTTVPIRSEHCAVLISLPFHHRDPFDRMLVAQSQSENMSLVSRDKSLKQYAIDCIW